jgi:hypothetical protein
MFRKFNSYEYAIFQEGKHWNYKIKQTKEFKSQDKFETAQEANFAAIGHIDLLEKGEHHA